MEVIFSNLNHGSDNKDGLRSYGLDHWTNVVKTLNGSIIKNDSLEQFDLYLISESSLFVYPDRVIILTCGTTTLLKALPSILESGKKMSVEFIISWHALFYLIIYVPVTWTVAGFNSHERISCIQMSSTSL